MIKAPRSTRQCMRPPPVCPHRLADTAAVPISVHNSQIYDDIANRLRAANEQVAVGGLVERFRSIDDRT